MLLGRHIVDSGVAVLKVVPISKRCGLLAGLLSTEKWPPRIIESVYGLGVKRFQVKLT